MTAEQERRLAEELVEYMDRDDELASSRNCVAIYGDGKLLHLEEEMASLMLAAYPETKIEVLNYAAPNSRFALTDVLRDDQIPQYAGMAPEPSREFPRVVILMLGMVDIDAMVADPDFKAVVRTGIAAFDRMLTNKKRLYTIQQSLKHSNGGMERSMGEVMERVFGDQVSADDRDASLMGPDADSCDAAAMKYDDAMDESIWEEMEEQEMIALEEFNRENEIRDAAWREECSEFGEEMAEEVAEEMADEKNQEVEVRKFDQRVAIDGGQGWLGEGWDIVGMHEAGMGA